MSEPAAPAPEPQRLRRPREGRIVAGVCAGLGEYFSLDSVVFRIAFVVLTLIGGFGLLLYLIAWILIPEDGGAPPASREGAGDAATVAGLILVAIGGLLLLRAIAPDWFSGQYVWPIVLILLGLAILARAARR